MNEVRVVLTNRDEPVTMVHVYQEDGKELWESLREYRQSPRRGTFIIDDKRKPVVRGIGAPK